MRILMVGAGATGGFYGGLLAKAGRDVTFLLRESRARQIHERGLNLELHTGEQLTVQPNVITAAELRTSDAGFDLVVVSTKAYQLAGALEDIAPVIRDETMILPILNGIRQITTVGDRFNARNVIGGSVRIMSYVDDEGRVVQMNPLDQLNFGELSGERTERILAVYETLRGCGFTANLQADIVDALWQKWMVLAGFGATCVVANGNAGQINSVPHGPELIEAVVRECIAIGVANGHSPDMEMVEGHLGRMLASGSTISSSMYRDMLGGAPVEADHILGDFLSRANGIPAPLLTAAYVRLKVYEASRNL